MVQVLLPQPSGRLSLTAVDSLDCRGRCLGQKKNCGGRTFFLSCATALCNNLPLIARGAPSVDIF